MNKTVRNLLTLVLFATILLFSTNVKALSTSQLEVIADTFDVSKDGNVTTLKLKKNTALDIIIGIEEDTFGAGPLTPKAENVVIDLAGHKLTNATPGCEAIQIYNGSTLTIKDSSGEKSGEITQIAGTTEQVLIRNSGTLNIENGKFSTIEGNNGGVIENLGNLTIEDGDFQLNATNSTCSTIFNKNGTVIIKDGTFSTKSDHSVISNAGKLTLSGGKVSTKFENPTNYLIDNMGDLTITGNAEVTKGASTSAAIGNLPKYSDAKITVSGGNLTSESDLIRNYEGSVEISGGELTTTGAGSVVRNSSGNLTITGGTLTAESADNAVYVGGNSKVNITGATIKSTNGSVYVDDPTTTEIEVDKNSGTLESKEVEGYGVFLTKDGKEITGKYEDIIFKVIIDGKEVTDIELVEGNEANIVLTAFLGSEELELANPVLSEVEDAQITTYSDGRLTALKVGATKLSVKLGKASSTINVTVIAATSEEPKQPEQSKQPEQTPQPEQSEQPAESEQTEQENDDSVDTPATGDYIIPAAIILIVVVAANVIYFIRKRTK